MLQRYPSRRIPQNSAAYKQGEFTQKKYRNFIATKKQVTSYDSLHGLNAEKQKNIVAKLGSIIPAEKLTFWTEMPVTEGSADLTNRLDK